MESNQLNNLTLDNLIQVLDINQNEEIRKKNETILNNFKHLSNYSPLLLEISANLKNNLSQEKQLNAAIQLKNYIDTYWKFTDNKKFNENLAYDDEEIIIISNDDKNYIRNNILDALIFLVTNDKFLIVKQYNQCIKKILKFDFEKIWKDQYMNKILDCLKSNNQQKFYSAIILFHQLSKIYEYEDEAKQAEYNQELIKVNDYFINFMNQCNNYNDKIQAQFMYKLLKIFFKSFQSEIPQLLIQEDVYDKWSNIITNIMKTSISKENLDDKKNIFWKLKKICYQTITRIIQKYTNMEKESTKNFKNLLINKYLNIYFNLIKTVYSNENSEYIEEYCLDCIYNFFKKLLESKFLVKEIYEIFNNNLNKDKLIKDAIIPYEDIENWLIDPTNYISKQISSWNLIYTKRNSVCKLTKELMNYKSNKKNKIPDFYNEFINYFSKALEMSKNEVLKENENIINIIKSKSNENNNYQEFILNIDNIKNNLINESILYLICNSNLLLKYSKENIESLIENYIYPFFSSPIELMKDRGASLLIELKEYKIESDVLIQNLVKSTCNLLSNSNYLPIKVYMSIYLCDLIEQKNVKEILKGSISDILSIYLKLIEQTDLEEIIISLQVFIKEFKNESREYIVKLSNYLILYFKKLIKRENEDKIIDDNNTIENIISTFSDIAKYFINDNEVYSSLEKDINIILNYCIKQEIYDKLESGIEILDNILSECNKVPNNLWNYFIPLIETVIGTKEDRKEYEENMKNKKTNIVFEGCGFDSISEIANILCKFISKDPNNLVNLKDENNINYIDYIFKLIENILLNSEENKNYSNINYASKLILIIFNMFPGKVDFFLEKILNLILVKYTIKIDEYKKNIKLLLSGCFIYNSKLSFEFFKNNNSLENIFSFWFQNIENLSNLKDIKYTIIAFCDLMFLNENIIKNNLSHIIKIVLNLTIKSNNLKIKKENEKSEFEESDEQDEENNKFKNYIEKNEDLDDEDFDDDDYDYDEDDEYYYNTEFENKSEILYVRDTLNKLNNIQEFQKIILDNIGNEMNKLQHIFNAEEERMKK